MENMNQLTNLVKKCDKETQRLTNNTLIDYLIIHGFFFIGYNGAKDLLFSCKDLTVFHFIQILFG
jgi:hypothetical protein